MPAEPVKGLSGETISMRGLILITLIFYLFFVPLFLLRSIGPFDFWWWMSGTITILFGIALYTDRGYIHTLSLELTRPLLKRVLIGIGSALLLYAFFYAGNIISRILFPFAGSDISAVYAFKGDVSPLRILLLMLFIIGPGEELIWRGFLQRHFSARSTPWRGFVLTVFLYGGAHIVSGNIMLVLAALVCGAFWGFLYMRYRSILLNIISHTLWDILIFIVLPVVR